MASVATSGFGSLFNDRTASGSQASWAIDPALGSDTNVGSPASPLRTMAEFNARMQSVLVVPTSTLQLVGDVVDAPLWLSNTRFTSTLTISGTRTTVATGVVISAVTGLGVGGTAFPWQLTTTGINWTTVNLQSQLRFSTGQVAFILAVIDANNVVVGAVYGTGISVVATTPTTSMTITVSTLSRALPMINNSTGMQANSVTPFVIGQDMAFDPANQIQWVIGAGSQMQLYGCAFNLSAGLQFISQGLLNLRACRVNVNASGLSWASSGTGTTVGLVVAGNSSTTAILSHVRGVTSHSNLSMQGTRLFCTSAVVQLGTTYMRDTTTAVNVQGNGTVVATGPTLGTIGISGFGIAVDSGTYQYLNPAAKPTITGASGDTRIGGVTRTYAQVPYVNLQTDAAPNTVTTLTGNDAKIIEAT